MTKLHRFLVREEISTAELAERSGYHRNHIGRIRRGESEPTRECIGAVVAAVRDLSGKRIAAEDLFDLSSRRKAS